MVDKSLQTREKEYFSEFCWLDLALGFQKYKRRTIGFGSFDKRERCWDDEIHLRELSFTQGGVGCAVWDASILLCQWLYSQGRSKLQDKRVLELGSGTGGPGIIGARFAREIYLTDYTKEIVENLRYNLWLNCEDLESKGRQDMKLKLSSSAKVEHLDWNFPEQSRIAGNFDVIIGSELTYCEFHVLPLLKTVEFFMKPNGVFYEVLGESRAGVDFFVQESLARGFLVEKFPLSIDPAKYCKTNQRSGERDGTSVKEVYLRVLETTIEAARQEFEKSALHYTASAGLKELRSLWESKLTASEHELDFPVEFFCSNPAAVLRNQSSLQSYTTSLPQYGVPQYPWGSSTFTSGALGYERRAPVSGELQSLWNLQRYAGEPSFTSIQDESGPIRSRKDLSEFVQRGRAKDTESITMVSNEPTSSFTTVRSSKRGEDKRSFSPRQTNSLRKGYIADTSSNKRARVEKQERSPKEEDIKKDLKSEESLDSELSGSDTELVDSVDNEEEPDNYILAQHERIRKDNKRGKWKIPLLHGVAHILGHEYLFKSCSGELLW
ncbi:Choline/ethanolaminephosphotransferase 1 [Galdieria sulphuraria]|nr:Choline/ethanolaminephosphotransferase 1 [Galdieria sulphuraria]